MRTLKRMVMLTGVVLLAATLVLAQGRGDRAQRGQGGQGGQRGQGRMMDRMGQQGPLAVLQRLDELDLTDEQKEKIKKLQDDFRTKMQADAEKMRGLFQEMQDFREKNPNDQEGLRKKREEMMQKAAPMREASQAFIEEVKGVLNEEQLKKFNEMVAQGGQGGPGGPGGRMGGGRMGMGAQGLPGTDPRAMAELELTDEQKDKIKGLLQRFMEEQKELAEKYQGLFKATLTPEQLEKYEKAQAQPRERMQQRPGAGEGGERGPRGGRREGAPGDRLAPEEKKEEPKDEA